MKVRKISLHNFDRLVARFKVKQRFSQYDFERYPWETDEIYLERLKKKQEERPISLRYYGKKHIIEFVPIR